MERRDEGIDGTQNDVALVASFRAGDRTAFVVLVRRYQRSVLRIALRMLNDRDAAEDVAQRVFIMALERIDQLRGSFRPWLMRIAVNLSKNYRRDTARLLRADEMPHEFVTEIDTVEIMDRAQVVCRVRQAITALSPRKREVVLLRIDGGLTFGEIADALGITENNAKVSYHLATKCLRMKLGAVGDV